MTNIAQDEIHEVIIFSVVIFKFVTILFTVWKRHYLAINISCGITYENIRMTVPNEVIEQLLSAVLSDSWNSSELATGQISVICYKIRAAACNEWIKDNNN